MAIPFIGAKEKNTLIRTLFYMLRFTRIFCFFFCYVFCLFVIVVVFVFYHNSGEVIVREGLALDFSTIMFENWIKEKGIAHVSSALRKASIENRMLEFLPPTRQTPALFNEHFTKNNLDVLVRYRQVQENAAYKQKLRDELTELISQEASSEEIVEKCHQHMSNTSLGNVDITVLVSVLLGTIGSQTLVIVRPIIRMLGK